MNVKLCALVAMIFVLLGCTTTHIQENVSAARKLALLFKFNDNHTSDPMYPGSLEDLRKSLSRNGTPVELPQCMCADGKLRDFIYLPGFYTVDSGDWAFLFAPPEMDPKLSIVVSLDGVAKVVQMQDADVAQGKSIQFIENRHKGRE